jgi:hypothetical protein
MQERPRYNDETPSGGSGGGGTTPPTSPSLAVTKICDLRPCTCSLLFQRPPLPTTPYTLYRLSSSGRFGFSKGLTRGVSTTHADMKNLCCVFIVLEKTLLSGACPSPPPTCLAIECGLC